MSGCSLYPRALFSQESDWRICILDDEDFSIFMVSILTSKNFNLKIVSSKCSYVPCTDDGVHLTCSVPSSCHSVLNSLQIFKFFG